MPTTFSPWSPIGPPVLIFPAALVVSTTVRRPGRIDVLGESADRSTWLASYDDGAAGTGWSGLVQIGQTGEPANTQPGTVLTPSQALGLTAVSAPGDTIDVYGLIDDGNVWTTRGDPDRWEPTYWAPISPTPHAAAGTVPVVLAMSPDRRHIVVVGPEGALWTAAWDSSFEWGTWQPIGDQALVDPARRQRVAAIVGPGERVDLFVIDREGRVITSACEPGQTWSPLAPIGSESGFASQALVTAIPLVSGEIALFAPARDGGVFTTSRAPGEEFKPWTRIAPAGFLASPPRGAITAVPRASGGALLFAPSAAGAVHETQGGGGAPYAPWTPVPNLGPVPAHAVLTPAVCREGRLDLFTVRADGLIHCATSRAADVALDPAVIAAGTHYVPRPPPPPAPPDPPEVGSGRDAGAGFDPLAAAAAATDAVQATEGVARRIALIVGVNRYIDGNLPDLKFCVNDAESLRDLLLRSGFSAATVLTDAATDERLRPTRENIKVELLALSDTLGPEDLLLVHFSCHGTRVGGRPALLPSNTRMRILDETAITVDELTRLLGKCRSKRIIVLLDACHTGADFGRDPLAPSLTPEFIHNAYELAQGMKVLAGATSQETAREREDKQHGAFTSFVLEALGMVDGYARADHEKKGFVTFDDLRDYVTAGVISWSRAERLELQQPNDGGPGIGSIMVIDYRK